MGCFGIGGPFMRSNGSYLTYGEVDDKESIKTIHRAIELGINIFDTADIYGVGRSEKVLGKALKGYRDDNIIATKFGSVFEEGNPLTPNKKNTSPEYIRNAVASSMKRLQTDFIDIYQLHSSNHDLDDARKVQTVLEELAEEGLIGGYGWSTDDSERREIFAESQNCNSVQYAMNITLHNDQMIKLCERNNLVGLIRSPLASGILTGKYNESNKIADNRMLAGVDFSQERYRKINSKFQDLKEIMEREGRTLIQGQLYYLMATSNTTIPIPGAKTVKQIEENAGALEFGPLKPNAVKEVNELFADV